MLLARLRTLNKKILLGVSLIVVLLLVLLLVVFLQQPSYFIGGGDTAVDRLPYWDRKKTTEDFIWRPEGESLPIVVAGVKRTAGKITSTTTNPGNALVEDGYTRVELSQAIPKATEAKTGFQKGNEVCVLTTSYTEGHEGLLEDTPDLDYVLECGTLP